MFGKILSKSIILSFGAVLFFSPVVVSAITCPAGFTVKEQLCVANNPFQGSGVAGKDKATDVIPLVITTLLQISGGLAVLFIILGGFRYITSRGNPEPLKKARSMVVNALIGLVVIIMSYVIVVIVTNLLKGT